MNAQKYTNILIAIATLTLIQAAAFAASHKNESSFHPNTKKPFEGEWRICIKDIKQKKRCASYFFLQQEEQICGTWQEIDGGKSEPISGFIQAIKQSTLSAYEKKADAVASVTFACGVKEYHDGGFTSIACGPKYSDPQWEKVHAGWELRTATCKNKSIVSFTPPEYGYSSICPTKAPYERNEYFPLTPNKKMALLQTMPWLQQCLNR